MAIINGDVIAGQIQKELAAQIQQVKQRKPCLAVLLVGAYPPSQIYVARKVRACQAVGILSINLSLPEDISEQALLNDIQGLNSNPEVDGILLQLPLPDHINPYRVIDAISPDKDVDGLHPLNAGKLLIGREDGFAPCTPLGIKVLLERSAIDVTGKHVVIMGRSNLVGKPLAALLMQNARGANATVTLVHSRSRDAKELCKSADLLVAAMGKPLYITREMVRPGAVVIDVGINKVDDASAPRGYRIVGDVDFPNVQEICSFITPVPKGVGPMTIAMLLSNTWKSYQRAFANR